VMNRFFEHFIGNDTAVEVEFDYEPPQRAIMHPAHCAQPGFDASIDVCSVCIGEDDILPDLSDECIGRLEEAALAFVDECIDSSHRED